MATVSLKCPGCDANLQLDDGREFAFCQFCGIKIMMDRPQTVNNNTVINNYYSSSNGSAPRALKCEIVRVKRKNDSMYRFHVNIDGFDVAKLKSGAVQPLDLDEGEHKVIINTHGFTEFRADIRLTSDTRLITGFDGMLKRRIFLRSERLQ